MFGPDQRVVLQLYDIPAAANYLEGLRLGEAHEQDNSRPRFVLHLVIIMLCQQCQAAAICAVVLCPGARPGLSFQWRTGLQVLQQLPALCQYARARFWTVHHIMP
jgi:hypothetical protein